MTSVDLLRESTLRILLLLLEPAGYMALAPTSLLVERPTGVRKVACVTDRIISFSYFCQA